MTSERELNEYIEEQPVRDKFEEVTDKIPEGPMGKVGGGGILGAAGYVAVESARPVWQFVPGLQQPGYKITAHGTKSIGDDSERHVLTVVAISREVAEFAAKYKASPSNIDYIVSSTKIVESEKMTERKAYSTYQMTVDVER